MTKKLHDPDKEPWEIVKELDRDGEHIWVRNDDVKLTDMRKNPYYVLATIEGEQTAREIDEDLHEKNRRYWNGWACAGMDEAERQRLTKEMELEPGELAPLSRDERQKLEQAFRERLPDTDLPEPDDVNLSVTYLAKGTKVSFARYVFPGPADFASATFSGTARFSCATFSGRADFTTATFSWLAYFDSATFRGRAYFSSATFSGPAFFSSATFSDYADFSSANFSRRTDFRSTVFERVTDFRRARFARHAPAFHACTLYQDTRFTTDDVDLWPAPEIESTQEETEVNNRLRAEENKSAYVRLRQLMNELHKPDDEHFFFRQEMRCDALLKKGWDRFVVWLFGLFSDFGHSVTRPALWLIGTIVVGWLINLSVFAWQQVLEDGTNTGWQAFGLSFSNTFAFLGFTRLYFGTDYFAGDFPAALKVLGAAQTLLGVVFLFFLGLGLRNRFRLK